MITLIAKGRLGCRLPEKVGIAKQGEGAVVERTKRVNERNNTLCSDYFMEVTF